MKRDVLLILAVTLVFGLVGGTPFFHPDGLVDEALTALENKGSTGFFWYPGLIIYLDAGVYALVRVACRWFCGVDSWGGLEEALDTLKAVSFPLNLSFDTPGHLVTVGFAFLGALLSYLTVRLLVRRDGAALLAASFVAMSLLWVRNAHYVTPDVPLGALCMLTVWLVLRASAGGTPFTRRRVIALGVCCGLVAATKYNGVVVGLPVLWAMLVCYRGTYGRMVLDGLIMAAVAAIVFSALNPYLFLDWKTAHEQFVFLANEFSQGKLGFETESSGWVYHLADSLYYGYGALPLVLAAVGLGVLIARRDIPARDKITLVAFPAAFYIAMGRENAAFARHIVPVLPFLGVLSALGGLAVYDLLRRRLREEPLRAVAAILVGAVLAPGAAQSLRHNTLLALGDTREDLAAILSQARDVPSLSAYAGFYTKRIVQRGRLDPRHFLISSTTFSSKRDPVRGVFRRRLDLVFLDSFSHDRLLLPGGASRPPPGPGEYEDLCVVRLTPFAAPKGEVPVTSESIYSPCPPDMKFRQRAGPFIEIYGRGDTIARGLRSACDRAGIAYTLLPGREGYYFNHIGGHIEVR